MSAAVDPLRDAEGTDDATERREKSPLFYMHGIPRSTRNCQLCHRTLTFEGFELMNSGPSRGNGGGTRNILALSGPLRVVPDGRETTTASVVM